MFGPVASDTTISRLIDTFATTGTRALTGCFARADVRAHVGKRVGDTAPDAGGQVIVDLDGALVRSEKQAVPARSPPAGSAGIAADGCRAAWERVYTPRGCIGGPSEDRQGRPARSSVGPATLGVVLTESGGVESQQRRQLRAHVQPGSASMLQVSGGDTRNPPGQCAQRSAIRLCCCGKPGLAAPQLGLRPSPGLPGVGQRFPAPVGRPDQCERHRSSDQDSDVLVPVGWCGGIWQAAPGSGW